MSELTEQAIFFELSVSTLGLQSTEVVENFSDGDLFLLPCGNATCEISPTKYPPTFALWGLDLPFKSTIGVVEMSCCGEWIQNHRRSRGQTQL